MSFFLAPLRLEKNKKLLLRRIFNKKTIFSTRSLMFETLMLFSDSPYLSSLRNYRL